MCQQEFDLAVRLILQVIHKTAEILRELTTHPARVTLLVFPESRKNFVYRVRNRKGSVGLRAEVLSEPLRRDPCDFFERAWFFEEVGRPSDNH